METAGVIEPAELRYRPLNSSGHRALERLARLQRSQEII